MAREIALTAFVALGSSGAPVHEPVHGDRRPCPFVLLLYVTSPRAPTYVRATKFGGHGADRRFYRLLPYVV